MTGTGDRRERPLPSPEAGQGSAIRSATRSLRAHATGPCSRQVVTRIRAGIGPATLLPDTGAVWAFTSTERRSLLPAELNVCCLRPLLPLRHLERNFRALIQRLEAAASDGREVDEQIVAAFIGGNEAVSLLGAEPLDGSGCHEHTPPLAAHECVGKAWSATDTHSVFPTGGDPTSPPVGSEMSLRFADLGIYPTCRERCCAG